LFVFWGDYFEEILKADSFNDKFDNNQAWIAAIVLMVSDLFLPIPASAVMSAIGSKYGMTLGFIINFSGLMLAGLTAYFTAGLLSKKASSFICSDQELAEYESFFNKWGGASIIISRALPILPEVTSLMAGFTKMNFLKYFSSLSLGSLGVSLFFTWIGHSNSQEPIGGIAIAVTVPLILWLALSRLFLKPASN
ncbi:MAG: VTT domain-containing protein, partial [Lentisphaeraceae bacterium]|nr:VTT domain-containing protein [Lentisphaeraceae bacterium]